jgi:hypothetical protein
VNQALQRYKEGRAAMCEATDFFLRVWGAFEYKRVELGVSQSLNVLFPV